MSKKKILIINFISIILICVLISFSYSKYSFNESFVAFEINNPTTSNSIINTSDSDNQMTSEKEISNSMGVDKEEKQDGWIDMIEIGH